MSYLQQLGDLDGAVTEAFDFAVKKAQEMCKNAPGEIKVGTVFNAIFWELMHDLLIVSRKQRRPE